jgi:molybdenum cofactor sulfurtransferase
VITCTTAPWVARKDTSLRDRLEDGTGATHSILALQCAIDTHNQLFGGLAQVSKHTSWLSQRLYSGLENLRHANGNPVCKIYKDPTSTYGEARTQGATVVFNICGSDGSWVGPATVGKLAAERNVLIRAGGLCNPAGMAQALGLSDDTIQSAYMAGFRCHQDNDTIDGIPFGMVRASIGAMSTRKDVDVFVRFVEEMFVDKGTGASEGLTSQSTSLDEKRAEVGKREVRKEGFLVKVKSGLRHRRAWSISWICGVPRVGKSQRSGEKRRKW